MSVYSDSGTVTLALKPSGSDRLNPPWFYAEFSPDGEIVSESLPGATEGSVGMWNIIGSERTDSGTVTLALQASGTESQIFVYADAATQSLDLQASGSDVGVDTDSATALLDLQPDGSDIYVPAGTTVDSGTVLLDLQPSGTDSLITSDSDTEFLDLQPDGTETRISSDDATNYIDLQPDGIEYFVVPIEYTDSDTVSLYLQPSSTDRAIFTDSATLDLEFEFWDCEIFVPQTFTGYATGEARWEFVATTQYQLRQSAQRFRTNTDAQRFGARVMVRWDERVEVQQIVRC